jgi:hypothetical protein
MPAKLPSSARSTKVAALVDENHPLRRDEVNEWEYAFARKGKAAKRQELRRFAA